MRRSYLLLLTVALFVALSGFTPWFGTAEQSEKNTGYTLRYNPKAGTSGIMAMDYSMNIQMDVMGQAMDMDQQMEMGANMTIVENTGSKIVTSMTYDYFAMTMENPMTGTMSWDSRKKDNEGMLAATMDEAFKEILGKEVTITQDMTGKTIQTEGLSDLMGMQSNQGSMDFKSILAMSQFPEKPVQIGESWDNTFTDPSSPMMIDIKMTLSDVRDGKVFVKFDSKVSANEDFEMPETEDIPEGAEQPEIDVSGTQDGTFVYEKGTMWLIEGLVNQNLDMKVEQMGMEIPMTVKGQMILTME